MKRREQGFTLIETLMYLGLFAILMGGAVLAAYNIIEGSNRSQTKTMIAQEGSFLTGKINWALDNVQSINDAILPGTLDVTRSDIGEVKITLAGTNMTLGRPNNPNVLNNSNVVVSNLVFQHQTDSSGGLVISSFTLTGTTPDGHTLSQDFQATKYLRK